MTRRSARLLVLLVGLLVLAASLIAKGWFYGFPSPIYPTATAVPQPTPSAVHGTDSDEATPDQYSGLSPVPTPSTLRYTDSYLGFAVESPAGWEVTHYSAGWELQDPRHPLIGIGFQSNLSAGEGQGFTIGRYSINVGMGEAEGTTLTDTVECHLSPYVSAEFRDRIRYQCCLTVGGEPAMELIMMGYPFCQWGCRQILVLHGGRDYWLTFYPDPGFNTPSDVAARAAFGTFLDTFTFIPITVPPTPIAVSPVPTSLRPN